MALPLVVGTMAVVSIFLATALTMAVQDARPARADQDAKAAVAAAQAGIDEYISRLNANSNYWELGNTDPGNAALTATGPGATVPGASASSARFRYQLLSTSAQTAQGGYITVRSTGTASAAPGRPVVSRSLTARLQPRGFLRYIYFTDVEALDPDLYKARVPALRNGASSRNNGRYTFFANADSVEDVCKRHHYDENGMVGRRAPAYTAKDGATYEEYDTDRGTYRTVPSDSSVISFSCSEIQWVTGDVVEGPLHSNDTLWVAGAPRFTDEVVESSWPSGPANRLWRGDGAPVGPTADPPGYRPRYAPPLDPPSQNTALLKHVRPKVDNDPNTVRPGCRYTGATEIEFTGTTMRVRSPNTTAAATPSDCLTVSDRLNWQTKPIPPVIYVASATGTCTRVGYPRSGENLTLGTTTDYSPCRGTAFVKGTVDDQVTVSADEDLVVTGDIELADGGTETDVVGLLAGNNVWVYHPITSRGDNLLSDAETVRTIEASILSLRHSFIVQNWDYGDDLSPTPAKRLRVYGSIAQKFRGPVGTGSADGGPGGTGYKKNYVYDERLQVLQPPFFLSPDNAPWEASRITDG